MLCWIADKGGNFAENKGFILLIILKKYKIFSMICYLVMGWCIIIKANLLPELLTMPGFILLLLGMLQLVVYLNQMMHINIYYH